MAETAPHTGSPFWRFSLGFYRRPGVAEACIALQDGSGVDVNILLFLLWLAAAKRSVPLAEVQALCAKAGPWRDDVVVPLRTLRRKLKDGSSLVERGTAELFRTKIKGVELEAERLQQEALFGLASGLTTEAAASVEVAARHNVAAYEQATGGAFARNAVDILLAALSAGKPDTGTAGA
jgi:uncharacterized protein (TIGR02444 family)